ncbi:hypothetical protein [Streptomyces sp. NPDC015131]|uniref:hypothetical protein n=1 Tax=Streptomyces sp. NPDC015131 TaxID=3364941 RepID=UPI0036F6D699
MNEISSDPHAMLLAMHNYDVPCLFQLTDECERRASWLAVFRHYEETDCVATPAPLCEQHMTMVRSASDPFWRQWYGSQPVTCEKCGRPVELDRIEPIKPT